MEEPKRAWAFVHIPKTAGMSISAALEGRGRCIAGDGFRHLAASSIRSSLGAESWGQAFTFSTIRNPWDRAVSLYLFKRRLGSAIASRNSFKGWLWEGELRPQWPYLVDGSGQIIVSYVLRFETLRRDFEIVCQQLGLDPVPKLPHRNAAPKRNPYRDYYDRESAEQVGFVCADELRYFGYSYE